MPYEPPSEKNIRDAFGDRLSARCERDLSSLSLAEVLRVAGGIVYPPAACVGDPRPAATAWFMIRVARDGWASLDDPSVPDHLVPGLFGPLSPSGRRTIDGIPLSGLAKIRSRSHMSWFAGLTESQKSTIDRFLRWGVASWREGYQLEDYSAQWAEWASDGEDA